MRKTSAYFYKIAATPQNSLEALRLLSWVKQSDGKSIVIGMGAYGESTRLLGPLFKSPLTYAALDNHNQTAPGQLTCQILLEQYQHRSLNSQTAVYGLIGDPVDLSPSDKTHNKVFQETGLKAIYVKIPLKCQELGDFISIAKQLPFQGLSVTMPLKEAILPYLDAIDPDALKIGAVNTLLLQEGKFIGFNTDGIGALNAIETLLPVKGKPLVLIGAGGAAKAIAYEARQRGAEVTIVNRHKEKIVPFAREFQCRVKGLEQMEECTKEGYAAIINCTPSPMPIKADYLIPGSVAMDIKTFPMETPFLHEALKKGCRLVYGYQMFIEQAAKQFNQWFPNQPQNWKKILQEKFQSFK